MKRISICLTILFLAGCNPFNRYTPPLVTVPQEWKGEVAVEEQEGVYEWWEVFNDPTLNCLQAKAVENNKELEQSWYTFREAAALSRVVRSKLFPQLTLNPSYQRSSQLVSSTAFDISGQPLRFDQSAYSFPFNGVFEVDLWNRLGLEARSAFLTAEARCWALKSLHITITAQLAENYFAIRTLDSELDILKKSIVSREEQVKITQARYDAGLVNYTDVSRSQTELTNVKADFEDVTRLREILVNAIAVLIGESASLIQLNQTELQRELPKIPAYLPSELLCVRPDIQEAEREVAAAHADIGVAWASFFPSFSLQGTMGYSSPFYTSLFDWKSRLWAYAYNLGQVVFDGGRLVGEYQASKDAFFRRIAAYEQTILIAFKEVEDALANIEYRYNQEQYLNESVRSSKDTLDLTNLRYENGVVDYLDVVDAERTNLDAERAEVRSRGAQFIATVNFIKSMGGNWPH